MTLTATANNANALRRMGRKRLSHLDSPLAGMDETSLDAFRMLKGASVSTGSWNGEQKALLSFAGVEILLPITGTICSPENDNWHLGAFVEWHTSNSNPLSTPT